MNCIIGLHFLFRVVYNHYCKLPHGDKCDWSFEEFLKRFASEIGESSVSFQNYKEILATGLKQPSLFLQRQPSEVRINSYNPLMLYLWRANLDVQYIINVYDVARYITSYMSKVNKGLSELLKNASTEIRDKSYDSELDVLKTLANKFIRGTEITAQEASLQVLNLPSHFSTTKKVFIPTSEPENRAMILKPYNYILNLPNDSNDVIYSNHFERYPLRPDGLADVCLADWYSSFEYVASTSRKKSESSEVYQLKNGQQIKRLRKMRVIRFVNYNELRDPENFCREQLLLHYPFVDETDLLSSCQSYQEAYQKHFSAINEKAKIYEFWRREVDGALLDLENLNEQNNLAEIAKERFGVNNAPFDDEDALLPIVQVLSCTRTLSRNIKCLLIIIDGAFRPVGLGPL